MGPRGAFSHSLCIHLRDYQQLQPCHILPAPQKGVNLAPTATVTHCEIPEPSVSFLGPHSSLQHPHVTQTSMQSSASACFAPIINPPVIPPAYFIHCFKVCEVWENSCIKNFANFCLSSSSLLCTLPPQCSFSSSCRHFHTLRPLRALPSGQSTRPSS